MPVLVDKRPLELSDPRDADEVVSKLTDDLAVPAQAGRGNVG
eukprot:gene55108-48019_t